MSADVIAQASTLDDQIKAFGSLVGLVLALATAFTVQRAAAIGSERAGSDPTVTSVTVGLIPDGLLVVLTLGLFGAGLPLWLDTLDELSLLRSAGAIRTGFFVVWVLLTGLLIWQLWIVLDRLRFLDEVRNPPTPP